MKDKYTERQKLAKILYKELENIREQKRALGYFKLKEPIQKGWKEQFKVREDILKSSDGKRYQEILKYIQNFRISRTTEFKDNPKYKFGLKSISVDLKDEIDFPDFYWDKYFFRAFDYSKYYKTGVEIKYKQYYFIRRPYVFESEILPNYIFQIPIIDPKLESREKELNNKIEKLNLWPTIYKNNGWRMRYSWDDYGNHDPQHLLISELEKEIRESLFSK